MTMFGTPAIFAVEAEPTGSVDKWRFGRFRMFVGGHELGDYQDTADLATGGRLGRIFLRESSRRLRSDLDDLRAEEVFHRLLGQYRVPMDGPSESSDGISTEDSTPYLLDELGESSLRDKSSVLVVRRGDGSDRVIVKMWRTGALFEHVVPAGIVDEVVAAYATWVEALG